MVDMVVGNDITYTGKNVVTHMAIQFLLTQHYPLNSRVIL